MSSISAPAIFRRAFIGRCLNSRVAADVQSAQSSILNVTNSKRAAQRRLISPLSSLILLGSLTLQAQPGNVLWSYDVGSTICCETSSPRSNVRSYMLPAVTSDVTGCDLKAPQCLQGLLRCNGSGPPRGGVPSFILIIILIVI